MLEREQVARLDWRRRRARTDVVEGRGITDDDSSSELVYGRIVTAACACSLLVSPACHVRARPAYPARLTHGFKPNPGSQAAPEGPYGLGITAGVRPAQPHERGGPRRAGRGRRHRPRSPRRPSRAEAIRERLTGDPDPRNISRSRPPSRGRCGCALVGCTRAESAQGAAGYKTGYDRANSGRVGTSRGACTQVGADATVYHCVSTLVLGEHQIALQGVVDFSQKTRTIAVSGGTGKYRRARGQVSFTQTSPTTNELKIELK